MKIINNNKIFVEIKDLNFIGNLPNFIIEEMSVNNNNGIEVFKNKKSIDFFNNKDEILNYNMIKNLREEEIYDLIHGIYEECFRLENKNKKSNNTILILDKYYYIVRTLKEYIDYKEYLDQKYYKLLKEN